MFCVDVCLLIRMCCFGSWFMWECIRNLIIYFLRCEVLNIWSCLILSNYRFPKYCYTGWKMYPYILAIVKVFRIILLLRDISMENLISTLLLFIPYYSHSFL